GVEWLGEVPEHWKVVRLKFIAAQIADCLHATPVYSEDGEYPAIRTADVQPGKVNIESARRVEERQYQRWTSRMVPQGGDILYSREGERFGIAAPVPEGSRLCISQRMMTFRIRAEHHAGFIMWQINTRHVYAQAAADQIGAAAPHVNVGRIRNFELVLPPRWEQEQIDEHIAAALIAPDKAIEQARREIRLLRELRTRLIADVVTGKLDVRQVAARLPEDDGDTVDEADYLDEDEPALEDMDLEAELEEIEA
ncbi:MAG: restriction endonuclease subunit S, partial [Rhodothermales bacterium]